MNQGYVDTSAPNRRSGRAGYFVGGVLLALLAAAATACSSGTEVPTPGPTPNDQELQVLTRTVIIAFDKAISEEDFTEFFDLYPVSSKTIITPGQLKTAYQNFIDQDVDLSGAATVDAVFDGPATREEFSKVILVKGHYPLAIGDVPFTIRFTYTAEARWQLHKFHFKIPE